MKYISALTGIFLIAIGCSTAEIDPDTVRIACVGDSITFGVGPNNPTSYPARLDQKLGEGFTVGNFGRGGATLLKKGDLPYVETAEYRRALEFRPDIVIIKLGTNDSKPQNWRHKDEYVADYVELVRTFQELDSNPQVWICLPVPAFEARWGINGELIEEEVLPLVRNVAEQTGVKLIDLHTPFLENRDMFPDMVHPDERGRDKMAEVVFEYIRYEAED